MWTGNPSASSVGLILEVVEPRRLVILTAFEEFESRISNDDDGDDEEGSNKRGTIEPDGEALTCSLPVMLGLLRLDPEERTSGGRIFLSLKSMGRTENFHTHFLHYSKALFSDDYPLTYLGFLLSNLLVWPIAP